MDIVSRLNSRQAMDGDPLSEGTPD